MECDTYFGLLSTAAQNIGMLIGVIAAGFATGSLGRKKVSCSTMFMFLIHTLTSSSPTLRFAADPQII